MPLRLGQREQIDESANRSEIRRLEDLGVILRDTESAVAPLSERPLLAALDEALAKKVGLNGPLQERSK